MKVALLLYGQARNIENMNVIKSHREHIINKYDTDVFCHTWHSKDNTYSIDKRVNSSGIIKISGNILDIITNEYKPIAFIHEEPLDNPLETSYKYNESDLDIQKFKSDYDLKLARLFTRLYSIKKGTFEFKHVNGEKYISNVFSQMYSINKVSKLFNEYCKSNNSNYDFVIITRYDFILDKFTSLKELDKQFYYIPTHHKYFPDIIHVFNPSYINSLYVYDNLDKILEKFILDSKPYDYSYNGLKSFWDFVPECIRYNCFLLNYSPQMIRTIYAPCTRNK